MDRELGDLLIGFGGAIIGGLFTLAGGYLQAHHAMRVAKRDRLEGLYQAVSTGLWEMQVAVELYKQEHLGGGLSEPDRQSLWQRMVSGSDAISEATIALQLALEPDHEVLKLIHDWRKCYQQYLDVLGAAGSIQGRVSQQQVDDPAQRLTDQTKKLREAIRTDLERLDKPFWQSLMKLRSY